MLGLRTLGKVVREVASDVATARERDPAARSAGTVEILSSWAGVQALLAHRVAHALEQADVPMAPMAISYLTRAVTGVEIHPAARIGDDFFIDHGSGVVIGETAEIGDRVTLYQGVTLGGTGFQRGKRHPTLGDNVTVGSGAKLLGPIEVGDGAKVGANTVVVEDVPRERDRRRQSRPHGQGRGPPGRGTRRRLDPPAGPDRGRDQGPLRADRRARGAAGQADRRAAAGVEGQRAGAAQGPLVAPAAELSNSRRCEPPEPPRSVQRLQFEARPRMPG